MTRYQYIPIDYFTYNRPEYVAAFLVLSLFLLFYVVLYMIFQYEYWNRIGYCHPMYYYGQACRNQYSNILLKDPQFLQLKKAYYDKIASFNNETKKYQGLRPDIKENDEKLVQSKNAIDTVIEENDDFVSSTLEEIKKLTTITHLITTKYLGNLEELLRNVKKAPVHVVEALRGLPEHLAILQTEIQRTTVNPLFAPYTAPLEKLYRSLTEIDKKTSFQRET